MEIQTGQHLGLEAPGAPVDRVGERRRTGRVRPMVTPLCGSALVEAHASPFSQRRGSMKCECTWSDTFTQAD